MHPIRLIINPRDGLRVFIAYAETMPDSASLVAQAGVLIQQALALLDEAGELDASIHLDAALQKLGITPATG